MNVNETIEIPNSWEGENIETVYIGLAVYFEDGTSFPEQGYGLASGLMVRKDVGDFCIKIMDNTASISRFEP